MAQDILARCIVWTVPLLGALLVGPACGSSGDPEGTGGSAGAPEDGGDDEDGAAGGRKPGAGGSGATGGSKPASGGGEPSSSGGGSETGTGGQGGAPDYPDTLVTCNLGGAPSFTDDETVLIDGFDDDDSLFSGSGLNGGWYAYGDGTAGTLEVSEGLVPVPGGVQGGAFRARAGGFSAWGSVFGAYFSEGCLFDGSAYEGLTFYAKGHVTGAPTDELSVRLVGLEDMPPENGGICESGCWNSPHVDVELGECWRRYSFRFDAFARDGEAESRLVSSELYLIDFAVGSAESSEVWIDELSFFVGDAPADEEICDE